MQGKKSILRLRLKKGREGENLNPLGKYKKLNN